MKQSYWKDLLPTKSALRWACIYGCFSLIFTLNGLLEAASLIESPVSGVLAWLSGLSDIIYSLLPISREFWFTLLIRWMSMLFLVSIILTAIIAIKAWDATVLLQYIVGLFAGLSLIPLISQLIALCVLIPLLLAGLFYWLWSYAPLIGYLISMIIFAFILRHLYSENKVVFAVALVMYIAALVLYNNVISFIAMTISWLASVMSIIVLIVLIICTCVLLVVWLMEYKHLDKIIAISGIIALLNVLNILSFIQYLSAEISRIFALIGRVLQPIIDLIIWLGWMIILVASIVIVPIVVFIYSGYCLFTSLRDPVTSGHSSSQLMICAFANTVGLSFILLVLSMNADHLRILSDHLPAYITFITNIYTIITNEWSYRFMHTLFSQSDLPLFDSLCITVSLAITVISLVMSAVSRVKIDSWSFCFTILAKQAQSALLGIMVTVLLAIIARFLPDASS